MPGAVSGPCVQPCTDQDPRASLWLFWVLGFFKVVKFPPVFIKGQSVSVGAGFTDWKLGVGVLIFLPPHKPLPDVAAAETACEPGRDSYQRETPTASVLEDLGELLSRPMTRFPHP